MSGVFRPSTAQIKFMSDPFPGLIFTGAPYVPAPESPKSPLFLAGIDALAVEYNKNSRAKGFATTLETVPEKLALIHSEITEAYEHVDDDRVMWRREKDGKPEGFCVELADAGIRVLDLAGAFSVPTSGRPLGEHVRDSYGSLLTTLSQRDLVTLRDGLLRSHEATSEALEILRGAEAVDALRDMAMPLAKCLLALEKTTELWLRSHRHAGLDIVDFMHIKHAFNVTRPYLHGKAF